MKRIISLCIVLLSVFNLTAQTTLTFTGRDANNHFIPLNRVVIANATQSWQETIYYPDTVLIMGLVGVEDYENASGFELLPNTPNPFEGSTSATLRTVEKGEVTLALTDMNGRTVERSKPISLQPGIHQFRIYVANQGTYMLTASQNGKHSSIKMVSTGKGVANRIDCIKSEGTQEMALLQPKGGTSKPFSMGDDMVYTGYAMVNGTEEESQTIHQNQFASESFVLNFNAAVIPSTDGQPCPGNPMVTDYDGNIYQTVQIGLQCWMRENLRTTHYSDGTGIVLGSAYCSDEAYRYYPNNDSNNVYTYNYGYLYNRMAVMHNSSSSSSNPSGVQGICPTGWHVPSNEEWIQLTNYVGSQSAYMCGGDPENIAKALASTIGWHSDTITCSVGNNPSTNNATGFSALPSGYFDGYEGYYGYYISFGYSTGFWSATQNNSYSTLSHCRVLYYENSDFSDGYNYMQTCYSVRCLRD